MIRGGWTGLLTLHDKGMDSVYLGLNNTSHLSSHEDIFARSWLRVFDVLSGEQSSIVSKEAYSGLDVFNNVIYMNEK